MYFNDMTNAQLFNAFMNELKTDQYEQYVALIKPLEDTIAKLEYEIKELKRI